MCPPEHFAVAYAINPWMDPSVPVDRRLALRQWEQLAGRYVELGHRVTVLDPVAELPDMVFAANAAFVLDGKVLLSRFRHDQRRAEEPAHAAALAALGYDDAVRARQTFEGEGDACFVGGVVLAAHGPRTARGAHAELRARFGHPLVSLQLVQPRYYHLDTALAVLDERTVAYLPEAFSLSSREDLSRRFPDAIVVDRQEAAMLALNAVSDGHHVLVPRATPRLQAELRRRHFEPITIDLSELRKSGGGAKCCTLELRPANVVPVDDAAAGCQATV